MDLPTMQNIPQLSKIKPDIITPIRFILNPKMLFNKAMRLKSEIFSFYMGNEPWIFLTGPEAIRYYSRLNLDDVDVFEFRQRMVPLNLPGADMPAKLPEVSRATNSIIKDFFEQTGEEQFSEIIARETKKYLDEHLQSSGVIKNFHDFIIKTFTHVLTITFLGTPALECMPENLGEISADIDGTVKILPLIFPFLPSHTKKQKQSKVALVKYLLNLIDFYRNKEPAKIKTVLDGYIAFKDEHHLNDGNIAWLFNAFQWAAIHYDSIHAFWVGIEILKHPTLLADLLSEQAPLTILDHHNIKNMHLLHGTVKESIRLNSIFAIPRRVKRDLFYKNYKIPQGTVLSISPYLEHRNPLVYKNPETLDPYRWGHWGDDSPSTTFVPGGVGYFGCLGMVFTIHFITVFWAVLLRNYQLDFIKKPPKAKSKMILMPPKNPVPIRYRRR